ncbi:MAG: H4MPT-linked C1 transfer pathway protein [Candidatus Helarchaeota archaeon]|nr:H4MPT-linked C1 transfer pathway protein [Candidatus Helarchaeota archaeon]
MVNIIGLDIGGVNLKGAFVSYNHKEIQTLKIRSEFYPMWLHQLDQLPKKLRTMIKTLAGACSIDAIGITMTAEVSDAYRTKVEGVTHILSSFSKIEPRIRKKVISTRNTFISIQEALQDYLAVASANWVATALYVGKRVPKCILVDIGSTTTDIIPITNGVPDTLGKTDTDRLLNGELLYTGTLRATIPSIVHKVPLHEKLCPTSFEKFALAADVHLLLDHINQTEYTCETADGRGTTKSEALARLARIVCADTNLLSEQEIYAMATYIYERQLDQIRESMIQVLETHKGYNLATPVVVTGLGGDFLAKKVAEQMKFQKVIKLEQELGHEGAVAAPAAAIAILLAEELEGAC